MYILRKPAVFCVFILLIMIGLFYACDDPNNPFSNNLGEKVVVEPPTISVTYPSSGSNLMGTVTFKGTAKAYFEVRKVEIKIFENKANNQKEINWTSAGISLTGSSVKEKEWTYSFDTSKYNIDTKGVPQDGSITIQFRVWDNKASNETVKQVYIIKNKPSDIIMATPRDELIEKTGEYPLKVNYGGEIGGQITDRRGLKPGYPQIKIWPSDFSGTTIPGSAYNEPEDNDSLWGYASLFLPGVGTAGAGRDDLQREDSANPAGQGTYANRNAMRVVNAAQFSFRLAEHTLQPDPYNPGVQQIKYTVDASGKHVPYQAGKRYYYRIKTSDTAFDLSNNMYPIDDPAQPSIEGYFPPKDYKTPFEDFSQPRDEPIEIIIFSSDTRPTVDLDNTDKTQSELDANPNPYITEPTSKKVAVARSSDGVTDLLFRLRIKITHPNGLNKATLEYKHGSGDRFGKLAWAHADTGVSDGNGGFFFTFYAKASTNETDGSLPWYNLPVFRSSSEPYTLTLTVIANDLTESQYRYTVYLDGEGPNVSIRSIKGADKESDGAAQAFSPAIPGGVINDKAYTVNGNIQAVIDRTDDSGIMTYNASLLPAGSPPPPAPGAYPMVKWIVEPAGATDPVSTSSVILAKLKAYQANPTAANMEFFTKDISADDYDNTADKKHLSGWVRTPALTGSPEDKANNFKFNTNGYDKKYLWLFVIAQDGVQNLGFIMQKIYVNEDTDKPRLELPSLSDKNAAGAAIAGPDDLNVIIDANGKKSGGNYSASAPPLNILEKNQGIDLEFLDDDGIKLEDITITLTDLNVTPNTVQTLTLAQLQKAMSAGNKKDRQGALSQAIMAEALYGPASSGNPNHLKDGMYKIEIEVKDDAGEKVAITPPRPGTTDTPVSVSSGAKTYWFAVSTELPELVIEYPGDNALGSAQPIPVYGYVKSRLKVQRVLITFTPDVISKLPTPQSISLDLFKTRAKDAANNFVYSDKVSNPGLAGESPAVVPDANGYYTYYWKMDPDVTFDPKDGSGPIFSSDVRNFEVKAYDRLGNENKETRAVQIDKQPPDVVLNFNSSRYTDADNNLFLYGKVSFEVSASDTNGLMEIDGYSGIKWWIVPASAPDPAWNTPFTADPNAGYNFELGQLSNGRYTGIIDIRNLTDGATYKLCIIAMDKAGNSSASTKVAYETFTVDQSKDYPELNPASLYPLDGAIKGRNGLYISGVVSDADLFDKDKVNSYVQIRFPATVDSTGKPVTWSGNWVTVPGTINPAGAIDFKIMIDSLVGADKTYFDDNGDKYYQIRVTDEPDKGSGNYGKNPDKDIAPSLLPTGVTYLPQGAVSKIFPEQKNPGDPDAYRFSIDATPPVIFFYKNDPNDTHPADPSHVPPVEGYTPYRPTFSNADDLRNALSGWVEEHNLSTLSFSYEKESKLIVFDPPLTFRTEWKLQNDTDDNKFVSPFITAPQGPQNIQLVAKDLAGLEGRVSWTFTKDTQGPDIILNNVSRAVKHSTPLPAESAFPGDWPLDWPNGNNWKTDPAWATWRTVIADWPSDYALYTPAKVIEELGKENTRAANPSTLSGDTGSGAAGSPPIIQGKFSDSYSFVTMAGAPIETFKYRFKDSAGIVLMPVVGGLDSDVSIDPSGGGWLLKQIPDGGSNSSSADWKITLDAAGGFTGKDGENQFDIMVQDSAGNWSFINGIRFLVDRRVPVLGADNDTVKDEDEFIVYKVASMSGWSATALPEMERVFSAAGAASGYTQAFTIQGTVSDFNLSGMTIVIGQDGYDAYKVTTSLEINPVTKAITYPASGDTVVGAPDTPVPPTQRLTLASTPAYTGPDGAPEWTWTLEILEKDVERLRVAAGTAENSARRFIQVSARDKANRKVGPVSWYFYLDKKKPLIEYTTLERGREGVTFDGNVSLNGTVTDETKISDVKYMIGRWDYAAATPTWTWYNGSTWTTTMPATASWPSAFAVLDSGVGDKKRSPAMNWTINQAVLDLAPAGALPPPVTVIENGKPVTKKLFDQEGQYRIDLYVTDWSLGNGNPHNTTSGDNTEATGFKDNGYNANDQTTSVSARVFYIDKAIPFLEWTDPPAQTYYRNDANGQVSFGFTAGDGNTIRYWEAVIKDKDGNIVLRKGDAVPGYTGSVPTSAGNIPVPAGLSYTSPDYQTLSVKPFMTTDGTSSGTALDLVGDSPTTPALPITYTITLTVLDGAKNTNSIQKQFTLDNKKPDFSNFSPTSYKYGTAAAPAAGYSYEAVSGGLTIRGNTADNSNQIKRVAFYLAPAKNASFSFPNPADITDATAGNPDGWHWNDGSAGALNKIDAGGQTLIYIEDGTFAWRLLSPQSSLFKSITNDYVQWTKTGGMGLNGTNYPMPGTYKDVDYNPATGIVLQITRSVPELTYSNISKLDNPTDKTIYGGEDVGFMTVYMLAEDMAGNVTYEVLKYWIWPEGDRPQIISINNPDNSKIKAERLLNGQIRLSGMASDNERVKYVWFRVLPSKDGVITGGPYTNLKIPVWDENTWEAKAANLFQNPVDGSTIGDRRSDDPMPSPTGGWYMANGGNAPSVSWWAYINTNDELSPQGFEANEITVEVRAQDVTWDASKNSNEGGWMDYNASYRGFASAMSDVSRVTAWIVAGAPIFENVRVFNGPSVPEPIVGGLWGYSIDTTNINKRSSYRVTVKHNSGISAIRWSPTQWEKTLNSDAGGFRKNPDIEAYNLLDLNINDYVWFVGNTRTTGDKGAAFAALTAGTTNMAMTIDIGSRKKTGTTTLDTTKKYLIWKWDAALTYPQSFLPADTSFREQIPGASAGTYRYKDLKNTIFTPVNGSASLGNAILIEAVTEGSPAVDYFKWDVIVDLRADDLLDKLQAGDPNYGNQSLPGRAGQTKNSVRYPVYLNATEVSKATPLTTEGNTLLPIDNLPPSAMYTLNRKPAGQAATIGGEAGDDGPVNGVARVVLWFQKKSGDFISWHERYEAGVTSLLAAGFDDAGTGPDWWTAVGSPGSGIIPSGVKKPAIPAEDAAGADSGIGASAIVIDRNSPSVGQEKWGHKLPMGFADGGMGKYWYVEINSYGITSGPVFLHYVVIDKAGNARYYRESLVIMNNAAVISKVKLATDIRHNAAYQSAWAVNTGGQGYIPDAAVPPNPTPVSPILDTIRTAVPLGTTDVEKGISADISSTALGVNNIVDFYVRNNLFALRVETTAGPGAGKDRRFRLEYVSGAREMSDALGTDRKLTDMKAGRVYIINDPGTAKWGAIGADGDGPWPRGYAFIAAVNGIEPGLDNIMGTADDEIKITGTGSVWELNSGYPAIGERTAASVPQALRLGDVFYANTPSTVNETAKGAEFVYNYGAFGTSAGNTIIDYANTTDAWPPAQGTDPLAAGNSMFILRVFDGDEDDMFGDFTIIRVRVNNNDKTAPFAQVYDINPKTEGQDRQNIAGGSLDTEKQRSVSPMFIGEGTGSNRTKGGLWNTAEAVSAVAKPGHIEPRQITYSINPYRDQKHSLSSAEMGGALTKNDGDMQKPWANPAYFFGADTVSGQVVLRGYAEDDQRIQRVDLKIGSQTVTILNFQAHAAAGAGAGFAGNSANYEPPRTGLLQIPSGQNGKVYFTDTIDLYRHRVEWAYVWDTETIPASTVVGNITVTAEAYNRDGLTANGKTASAAVPAPGTAHSNNSAVNKPNTSPYNPGFPAGLYEYNQITMNIRPYITGFLRNQAEFSHNTRSRQGRYMFYRGETAVVAGFNLGGAGTTAPTLTLGGGNITTADVGTPANFGITTANNSRYRQFTVGTGAVTGNGLVTYSVTGGGTTRGAVNTGSERAQLTTPAIRPTYIQPWNVEYSPGAKGSELWDDFTQAHIWQSNDTAGNDGGRFASRDKGIIMNPAMSINPRTGVLYESHNASGGDGGANPNDWFNSGRTIKSAITAPSVLYPFTQFADPIFYSDVYRAPSASDTDNISNAADAAQRNVETWAVSVIIGRSSNYEYWDALGGVYVSGPGGNPIMFHSGGNGANEPSNPSTRDDSYSYSLYHVESTWYNASENNKDTAPGGRLATPPSTDQFMNPHIVTSGDNSQHIHVSYYDDKDGSIKYRYNRRGTPGTIDGGVGTGSGDVTNNNNIPKMWTNLDGGLDQEDLDSTTYTWSGGIAGTARVKNYTTSIAATKDARGNIKAGKHNSIAVTGQGCPVIAYYDETNQKLKLAVSSTVDPVLADYWTIIDNVIPSGNKNNYGTGEFVSMKIDTTVTPNIIHIAAMNTNKRLVYVTGKLNGSTYTFTDAQVVDRVGSVGRWCALSLDQNGNPWISYMDESYLGARDGVKVAFLNKNTFYKGSSTYYEDEDIDMNGVSITGWEAMHVPTAFRVQNPTEGPGREHGRLGMECLPARNHTYSGANRFWNAAVGYLSQDISALTTGTGSAYMDRYRVAYYVK